MVIQNCVQLLKDLAEVEEKIKIFEERYLAGEKICGEMEREILLKAILSHYILKQ